MLEEKILQDYKDAMKNKDTLKSQALSFLRAQIMSAALEKKKNTLDDNEITAVIRKQVKQRQDSIEQFNKGGRLDLAEKEMKELELLKSYLPQELSVEEIKKIIEEAVQSTGACGIRDMGKVMKDVVAKLAGKADSKLVSDMVKERLIPKE